MYHSRLSKPKVSEVTRWDFESEDSNETARVYTADIDSFFYKVVVPGKRPAYFYGETAWQDARRYAGDQHIRDYTSW